MILPYEGDIQSAVHLLPVLSCLILQVRLSHRQGPAGIRGGHPLKMVAYKPDISQTLMCSSQFIPLFLKSHLLQRSQNDRGALFAPEKAPLLLPLSIHPVFLFVSQHHHYPLALPHLHGYPSVIITSNYIHRLIGVETVAPGDSPFSSSVMQRLLHGSSDCLG
jgi:hypothetical protein